MKWRVIIAVNFPIGKKKPEKIRASTGFEPVTSAIPVRCSTNRAMKPFIGNEVNLGQRGQYINELFHMFFTSLHRTGKYELNKLTSPNGWLHSSVGRASHRYRGGHGFESRWNPDFFRLLFSFFFRVYVSPIIYVISCCCYFSVSILT